MRCKQVGYSAEAQIELHVVIDAASDSFNVGILDNIGDMRQYFFLQFRITQRFSCSPGWKVRIQNVKTFMDRLRSCDDSERIPWIFQNI